MRLSKLQQFILEKCYGRDAPPRRDVSTKADFYNFYTRQYLAKNKKIVQDVVHKSLESLTAKDLIVSFGKKTAKNWSITRVKLTPRGRKKIRQIIKSRQKKLPIK